MLDQSATLPRTLFISLLQSILDSVVFVSLASARFILFVNVDIYRINNSYLRETFPWSFRCVQIPLYSNRVHARMCTHAAAAQIDASSLARKYCATRSYSTTIILPLCRACVCVCVGEVERRPPFCLFAFATSLYTTQAVLLSVL